MQLINNIYTLLTLALLLLAINYFANFVAVPNYVVLGVLVLSALVFFIRMYMRFKRPKP